VASLEGRGKVFFSKGSLSDRGFSAKKEGEAKAGKDGKAVAADFFMKKPVRRGSAQEIVPVSDIHQEENSIH